MLRGVIGELVPSARKLATPGLDARGGGVIESAVRSSWLSDGSRCPRNEGPPS